MKFTSTKLDKTCVLSMNVVFDPDLLTNVKKEDDDGYYSASYDMTAGGVLSEGLFPISETMIVVRLTRNSVFVNAVICVDEDDESVKAYSKYIQDGMIEFNVQFTDEEKIKLLLAIIQYI